MNVKPAGDPFGATVEGLDLAAPLSIPATQPGSMSWRCARVTRSSNSCSPTSCSRNTDIPTIGSTVLMWDDIGTLHNAQADYGPDERRRIKRCQVMADRIFDPVFVEAALQGAA
jgi:hypothetical protein